MPRADRVLITGATGAIGGALARVYAASGTHLILHGRNAERLRQLAAECEKLGANVEIVTLDLRDLPQLFAWIERMCDDALPDLVFANAGVNIHIGEDRSGESWHEVEALLDINIRATFALVNRLAEMMRQRGAGQLVLISSLAAWFGLPITPSYCASKAALKAYGESLRGWLADSGVGVTVVMPGFVSSRMCHQMPGPKPFLWRPEQAARVIQRGVARNRARISFPFPLNFGCWWLAVLPAGLSQRILRWLKFAG